MISANLINNLKDSKRQNKIMIKAYKHKLREKVLNSKKDIKFMEGMCILLESENKDIDNIIRRYNNVANRKRKKLLGIY